MSFAAPALLAGAGYSQQILAARVSAILLIGVPFILLVYASLLHACGRAGASMGTSFLALSPNLIAHAGLATTDMCFVAAALAALLALTRFVEQRTPRRLLWLGAAWSAALAAKYSAIALFPAALIVLTLTDRAQPAGAKSAIRAAALVASLFAIALVATWTLHGFAWAPTKLSALGTRHVPAAVAGIISQALHQRGGHPAFMLGRTSAVGWWYYMPVALALKSTPAELIAFGIASVAAFRRRSTSASALTWRVTLVSFTALALVNRLDLGIRYVLIVIPLLIFVAVDGRPRASRPVVAVFCGLLLAQFASASAIAPHYLSYFNRIAGGPETGYRLLADSNIDWGQDLPSLRVALARHGARAPLLSYFGNAPFDAYGVVADVWDGDVQRDFTRWDWVAISATHLDGLFVPSDVFQPFREVPPSDRAGYSILMYSTDRPDVRAAMEATARRWREIR
ncbi:MAG TPA: glycosyltransferase family 39 protein [Vicinamibacterales bacterium]|nr:glycosyltransferase family 39 protein [Vicinamibacterales bacterium]